MNGSLIVLLPINSGEYTYKDGDVAPFHQTTIWLGESDGINEQEVAQIISAMVLFCQSETPVTATIMGKGVLGPDYDPVVFTQSHEQVRLRQRLLMMTPIYEIHERVAQHPTWIPHISGYDGNYGEFITFNRFGFWHGNSKYEFEFGNNIIRTI